MANTTAVKTWLKHPLTGDAVEVEATHASLVPLMVQGYQQFTPSPSAHVQFVPATPATPPPAAPVKE
jgi:hypothetical protein